MSFNSTVPTFSSGQAFPSATFDTYVAGGLNGIQAAWTSSAVAFFSGVTVGNGTSSQFYNRVGHSLDVRGQFTFGTTTSFTGTVNVLFPLLIASTEVIQTAIGSAKMFDTSAVTHYPGACFITSLTNTSLGSFAFSIGNPGIVNATGPTTWATGDVLSWRYKIELA